MSICLTTINCWSSLSGNIISWHTSGMNFFFWRDAHPPDGLFQKICKLPVKYRRPAPSVPVVSGAAQMVSTPCFSWDTRFPAMYIQSLFCFLNATLCGHRAGRRGRTGLRLKMGLLYCFITLQLPSSDQKVSIKNAPKSQTPSPVCLSTHTILDKFVVKKGTTLLPERG